MIDVINERKIRQLMIETLHVNPDGSAPDTLCLEGVIKSRQGTISPWIVPNFTG